jgi:DNA-binding winged helix-turn-helix (wHTH) protein
MVTYRFGPYRLSPDTRCLERDGVAVRLTPKAFDLLVTLVRHRARALAKDEIIGLVWAGTQVEEGNLAQQILLLRRALADAGECIATVPRYGYRFVAPIAEEVAGEHAPACSPHALVWDGREFPLREGVTVIGRAEDADLRLLLPSVSRHHARVIVRGLEATLEDLGSRRGSWRGTTLVKGAVRLVHADEITLGSVRLVYWLAKPDGTTLG